MSDGLHIHANIERRTIIPLIFYLKEDGSVDLDRLKMVLERTDKDGTVEFPNGDTYPIPAVWYIVNLLAKGE